MMKKLDHNVLAEGEATGHAHRVENGTLYQNDDELVLEVSSETSVVHEEHGVQTISPGTYDIDKVKEFDPFAEEIRNVVD